MRRPDGGLALAGQEVDVAGWRDLLAGPRRGRINNVERAGDRPPPRLRAEETPEQLSPAGGAGPGWPVEQARRGGIVGELPAHIYRQTHPVGLVGEGCVPGKAMKDEGIAGTKVGCAPTRAVDREPVRCRPSPTR